MKSMHKRILSVVILVLLMAHTMAYMETTGNPEDAKDKLENIQSTEKETTEALFSLYSEIEFVKVELSKIEDDLSKMAAEQEEILHTIDLLSEKLELTKDTLRKVLVSRQKMGSGSMLQIVLESDNIGDLLDRLNLIRDLSRNTSDILTRLDQETLVLENEKRALDQVIAETKAKQSLMESKRLSLEVAIEELEVFLEALSSEKATYQAYLESIDDVWKMLKPLFTETVENLNEIIANRDFPEDTIEVRISLFSATGIIDEKKFNHVLSEKEALPTMVFDFQQDRVFLSFPEYNLEIEGVFVLLSPQSVEFKVTSGIFYKLPMAESALNDLFSEGNLVFELGKLLGKNEIKRIEHVDDRLILSVGIKLF